MLCLVVSSVVGSRCVTFVYLGFGSAVRVNHYACTQAIFRRCVDTSGQFLVKQLVSGCAQGDRQFPHFLDRSTRATWGWGLGGVWFSRIRLIVGELLGDGFSGALVFDVYGMGYAFFVRDCSPELVGWDIVQHAICVTYSTQSAGCDACYSFPIGQAGAVVAKVYGVRSSIWIRACL